MAERTHGEMNNSSANALLREAENRLRQAEHRHKRAEQREAAAAELEDALRASRAELSRREGALALSLSTAAGVGTRAVSQEHTGPVRKEEVENPMRSSVTMGLQQATSAAGAVAEAGISLGVSEGQGWAPGLQSLALGSSIREASPSSHGGGFGWGATAGRPDDSHGTSAAGMRGSGVHAQGRGVQGGVDVETKERQLEEWSNALAEQAGAMREQALRLETAYDQLREREAASSVRHQKPEGQHGGSGGPNSGDTKEEATAAGSMTQPNITAKVAAREEQQRSGKSSHPPPAAAARPPAAVSGGPSGDAKAGADARQQQLETRQLERETVRLAEKGKELDAERRRLKLAAEVADREHARAQAERQEASEARKDAAVMRVGLERERTRLEAEKGGLAAERSLLAAERGRLATERARSRREDGDLAGAGATEAREPAQTRTETQVPIGGTAVAGADGVGEVVGSTGMPENISFAEVGDDAARVEGREGGGFQGGPEQSPSVAAVDGFATVGADRYQKPADFVSGGGIGVGGIVLATDEAEADSSPTEAAAEGKPVEDLASRGQTTPDRLAARAQTPAASATPVVRQLGSELAHESGLAGTAVLGRDNPPIRPSEGKASVKIGGGGGGHGPSVGEEGAGAATAVRGGQSHVDGEGRRVNAPSVASVRRRLQGGGGRRWGGGESDKADSSDEDSSPAAVKAVRRRPGAPAATTTAAAAVAAPRSASSSPSLERSRGSPSPLAASGRGQALGQIRHHRPVPEDPFLAQLHARLAGADHTLRQSLGRRQALLNRFGTDGSSIAPTSEGEDTSDQNARSAASADASPEAATGSSSSSPLDGNGRRRTATEDSGGAAGAAGGVVRGDLGLGLESSPDTDSRGGRFGYTGVRGAGGGGRGRGRERIPRRSEPGGNGEMRLPSRLAPAAVAVVPMSESMTPKLSPSRENATAISSSAAGTAAAVGTPSTTARGGAGGSHQRASNAGHRRAGSDTDDTEAEKENLRSLMLALGAADTDDDGGGGAGGEGDERGRGHRVGVEDGGHGSEGGYHDDGLAGEGVEDMAGRGSDEHAQQRYSDGEADAAAPTGEADAGGGNTLMSSLRAQNEDISSRLQDMSLQVSHIFSLSSFTNDVGRCALCSV